MFTSALPYAKDQNVKVIAGRFGNLIGSLESWMTEGGVRVAGALGSHDPVVLPAHLVAPS